MKIKLSAGRLNHLIREWLCDELHRINVEADNKWTRKEVEQGKNIIRRTGKLTFVTTDEGVSVEINVSISTKRKRISKS